MNRYCQQPDRDVPKLTCGYPLPCPHHTLVLQADGRVRVPARGSVVGAVRVRAIGKALRGKVPR